LSYKKKILFLVGVIGILGIGYNAYHWSDGLTQNRIGYLYSKGVIGYKNDKEAFQWFERSASKGNLKGITNLGACYLFGLGVDIDHKKAFDILYPAAQKKYDLAAYYIGACFCNGLGTRRDLDEAEKWLVISSLLEARDLIERIHKEKAPGGKSALNLPKANKTTNADDDASSKLTSENYEKGLSNNDPESLYFIGVCNLFGLYGKPVDYDSGYKLIRKAAEAGNKNGKAALGWCYFLGAGVKQDDKKAFEVFEKNAKEGIATAEAGLGFCYMFGRGVLQNDKEAFFWTKKAAEHGEPKAEWNLGVLYIEGKGVKKDINEGLLWLEKGAVYASSSDQRKLGYDYEYSNETIPKNLERAAYWYQKAADNGNCCGLYSIGLCYLDGKGVQQSYEKGFNLLQKAKSKNCEYAKSYLRENYYGPELAGKASAGDSEAQLMLGRCYLEGLGIEKQPEVGFVWIKKAADNGNKNALNVIGVLYEKGIGTEKNAMKAIDSFKKASDKGNANAQTRLGDIYMKGELVSKDMNESVKYLNLAAKAGETRAQNNLAWILATSTNSSLRNGKRALALAMQANAKEKDLKAYHLGTLAAAYAENGQFTLAVATQEKAISMLKPEDKKEQFLQPLKSYQEQKAWRDND